MESGRLPWWQLGLVIAVALALRFYRIGEENFWIDEVLHVESARRPVGEIVRGAAPAADGGPLTSLVTRFLHLDASEAAARAPAAVSGTATVAASTMLATYLLPSPGPLAVGVLLATSPAHVWYSQEARWYGPWILLTVLSYLALFHALERGSRRAWGCYAVAAILGIYTFVLSVFIVAAQVVTIWWYGRRTGIRMRLLPASLAGRLALASILAPLVWLVISNVDANTGTPRPPMLATLPYTAYVFAVGTSLGPTIAYLHDYPSIARVLVDYPGIVVVAILFAIPLVAGLVRVLRDETLRGLIVPWLFVPPFLVLAMSFVTNVVYEVRYVLSSLPAFVIVLTAGLLSLRPSALRTTVGTGVLACIIGSLENYYWNPLYDREDVRAAIHAIDVAEQRDSPVVVVGQINTPARWYGRHLPLEIVHSCAPEGAYDPLARERITSAAAMWVLAGRDWTGEASRCLTRLAPDWEPAQHERFKGVELWRLERRAG